MAIFRSLAPLPFLAALLVADTVVMKNGDRVSGSIVKKDAATLTIDSTHFGTVTLPWAQVESVAADKPINVVLASGKAVQATLATADGKVEVASGASKDVVAPADIATLRNAAEQKAYERLLKPRIGDLWAGTATIGWAGAKGNAETGTFTIGLGAARVTRSDKASIYFNTIKASAFLAGRSQTTAQAVRGGWGYNRNINKRLFANTFNDWEYDRFQNLDLRTVLGGGAGLMAWKGESGRLDLVGGAAWNREKFDPAPKPAFVRNSAEAYWGDDFAYKLSTRTALTQNFRMFNNLSNTGAYRVNFDTGATTKVFKWLTWNIAVSDRFLSNPVPGRKKNDFLYTTGFGINFAR
jgi:putative salt-induced outer membrane protein YdiY